MNGKVLLCWLYVIGVVSCATHVQKRADDVSLATVSAQVSMMASQMSLLTADITALKNQIALHQASVDTLSKNVAFYVFAGNGNPGISVSSGGTVVLANVVTNVGAAYDPDTGFFVAPVAGLYQFHVTFMAYPDSPRYVHASLQVDASVVATTISDSRHNYFDNVGMHPIVHVRAGGKVHIINSDSSTSVYYPSTYTSFAGFLIRAD